MEAKAKNNEVVLFKDMKQKIDEIERLVQELKTLGKGLPVVEKNARNILSFTHALKFGISDVADVLDA